ncbi:helix-turn-helix domain-containing protein [Sphingomonas sp. Y38-1Y]|uniref:helix-turn-helix domain-containing protein n=1 Tax=Sphingomonas sp. Y38-1Y TaxID=3078265 RepID=UPI0028E977A0|nr:RodZ domain-containing protein [Sphingomonas sp. Y38-1Y]
MVDEAAGSPAPQGRERVGDRLRAAREAAGLTLADVGQRTRIPLRHLEAIETSTYGSLPSITYAMGFVRAYARTVGADEVSLAGDLRGELSTTWAPKARHEPYALAEPARLPPRGLALAGVFVAVLILAGVALWYGTSIFRGEEAPQVAAVPVDASPVQPAAVPQPAPTPTGGQVRLTATDEVWVRVYDAANDTLLIKTMQKGETFDVPANANRPQINVGRPDKLAITIDGQAVPALGTGERPIKDVGISADALRARAAPAGA